jgi:hypothetical protein
MDEQVTPFNSRTAFTQHVQACMARAQHTLDLFDPDGALFALGTREVDQILRSFLRQGGRLSLAMHTTAHIERDCPRFLRLLRDVGHQIECRVTSRGLRQLTDSFCIADGLDIVRRFHSDHARGETSFGVLGAADLSRERFSAIWEESSVALHPTITGL